MAGIREELTLVDNFSGTFNQFNTAANASIMTAQAFKDALDQFTQGYLDGLVETLQQTNNELEEAANGSNEAAEGAEKTEQAQKRVTLETKASADAAAGWVNQIKSAVAALGVAKLAESFVETADEIMLTNARLESVGASQEAVFAAAQRSRGAYQDIAGLVTRIGQNASDTFNTNEAVLFAENLNKSFKLAGASQGEIQSATLQLSQALGAGALRGEEFNAIMESAPSVIQRIADTMGVSKGEMKDLAAEGKITADIIKQAMLSADATKDLEAKMQDVPMTWADVMTQAKNEMIMALSGIAEEWSTFLSSDEGQAAIQSITNAVVTFAQIGSEAFLAVANGIAWVNQNWEQLLPIINIAAAAILTYAAIQVGSAVMTAAAWAMANWQVLLIVAAVGLVITVVQAMGATWQDIGRVVGGVLGFIYAYCANVFILLWNGVIAPFAEFFSNVFNDPVAAIVNLFADAFSAVLGFVEQVAAAIDAVLGSNLSGAISGFSNDFVSSVKAQYTNANTVEKMEYVDITSTVDDFASVGASLGGKLDNMNLSLDGILGGVNSIDSTAFDISDNVGGAGEVGKVGSVGKIDNDVTLSDEDLKIYRDLAEQRYMNRVELKTLAPNINVSMPNSSGLQATDVADAIKAVLIEQMSANTATAH